MQAGLGRARSMLTSFAAKSVRIGIGAGLGALGVGGIGAGLLSAAKRAADLGESVSKVRVVFGASAQGMIDQADDLARRFGVVKQSALDAGAAFGLMGRAAGMTREEAAGLGQEFVQIGLDLASIHNISNEEAFEKIRSGLAGEAEPLRPLGIFLSEDAVKAEALASGLIKVKRELTETEKIRARAGLIRKQQGDAKGDLERTADSAANQMRKLEGELANAAVDFGEHLQGALKDAISLAHELGAAIKAATGKEAAEGFGELVRAGVNVARASVMIANGERPTAAGLGMPLTAEATAPEHLQMRAETADERATRLAGGPDKWGEEFDAKQKANKDAIRHQGALAGAAQMEKDAQQAADWRAKHDKPAGLNLATGLRGLITHLVHRGRTPSARSPPERPVRGRSTGSRRTRRERAAC